MSAAFARIPFWKVQAVFDPDGTGGDFAYTIGLADRGLSELHMWARPTHGDDVGADFLLSSRDLCGFLNEFAWEWLEGSLRPGDTRDVELDFGLSTASILVGQPVHPLEVEALGARSDAVIPLRWSLKRQPRGSDPGIDKRDEMLWRTRINATRRSTARVSGLPPFVDAMFEPGQPYGPLTAWAIVLAHVVAGASPSWVIHQVAASYEDSGQATACAHLESLARPVGRVGALEQVRELADRVADVVSMRRAWREEIGALARAHDIPVRDVRRGVEVMVGTAVRVVLYTAVLEDVLESGLRERYRRPWAPLLACKHGTGELADGR